MTSIAEELAEKRSMIKDGDTYIQRSLEWRQGFVAGYNESQLTDLYTKDHLFRMYLEGFNKAVNQGNNLTFDEALEFYDNQNEKDN